MHRLGVVSFLNSKPLIDGLGQRRDVELVFDVPSRLPELLNSGRVDVALIPIVDVIRSAGRYRVVSDACIGCDGETMTVRIFSQTPPDRIRTLHVDGDSHTSKALATVMWRELYDVALELRAFDARTMKCEDCKSVLLIGDKVVSRTRGGFAYEVDLGAAWRQHTGLPFVFAVWTGRRGVPDSPGGCSGALDSLLSDARDSGVARAREIAAEFAPKLWWPTDLAVKYLSRCLKYKLDARYVEGANLFARLCATNEPGLACGEIAWPEALAARV
jgi:chorismate dehydratase